MKIDIPFNDMFREPMLSGQKTMTSRSKWFGKKGDTFLAFGKTFIIVDRFWTRLENVAERYCREEGFESTASFIEFWAKIHPIKKYKPDWIVYVHMFKLLGGENVSTNR